MIRRINLIAGPAAGKSTTSAFLFSEIKRYCNINNIDTKVELIQEFVKNWAWGGRKIDGWDQWVILINQLEREYHLLRDNRVDLIVTDSPLLMYPYYAERGNCPVRESIIHIVREFDIQFPALNIFLRRNNKKYFQHGRYETLEQAREADEGIKSHLICRGISFMEFDYEDSESILDYVLKSVLPRI